MSPGAPPPMVSSMRTTMLRRPVRAASLLAVTLAVAAPAAASAATVHYDPDGTLVVTAATGERNDLGVQDSGETGSVNLYDSGITVTGGLPAGCTALDDSDLNAQCAVTAAGVRLELGDGDEQQVPDRVRVSPAGHGPLVRSDEPERRLSAAWASGNPRIPAMSGNAIGRGCGWMNSSLTSAPIPTAHRATAWVRVQTLSFHRSFATHRQPFSLARFLRSTWQATAHVFGPTIPSTVRPWFRWNRRVAAPRVSDHGWTPTLNPL